MYEAIIDQLKQKVAEFLQSNHNLNATDAANTADVAGKSLLEIVKEEINRKDFSTVNEALSGTPTDASHASVQKLIEPLGAKISERTGMPPTTSLSIANTLLPYVFNMFNDQVQEATSKGINVKDVVRQLAGGGFSLSNMGSMMTLAKTFMKDKSGKSNGITDVLSKFF